MDNEEALYWLNKVFPGGHARTDIYGRPVFFMWFLPAQSIEIPEGMVFAKDLESITKLIIDSFMSNANWRLAEIRQLLKDKDNLKQEIKTAESYLAILQTLASEYIETNYIPFTLPEKDYRARLLRAIKACKERNNAKIVQAIEFNPSQAEARKYYEARLKELKEQDPIANKDEIESIEMLLMIAE